MTTWITTAASLLVAVLAGLFAYRNNQLLHRRHARLERVNSQIGEFYGPLFSIIEANHAAWDRFRKEVRTGDHPLFENGPLTPEEATIWIQWMLTVFMPSNRRMYELVVTRAHLLLGEQMHQSVLDFCAHVAYYEVLVSRWKVDDYSELTSPLEWPAGFREYVRKSFADLKSQQQKLLALVHAPMP